MNQKLSDWASIAEIVSGIAVLVTLVFLVLEIRDSTNVTRASMYGDILDSLVDNRTLRLEDPELDSLVQQFLAGSLSDLDFAGQNKLITYLQNVYQLYEKAYYSREYGVIGASEWGRFERIICTNYSRVDAGGLRDRIGPIVSETFWEYIVETCE